MTESTASGKRRRSKQRNHRLLDSIMRERSPASYRNSGLPFRLRISSALNQRDFLWGLLAFCGVAAPIILIVLIVVGAAVTIGYNHVSEPISQLAATGSPHPGWIRHSSPQPSALPSPRPKRVCPRERREGSVAGNLRATKQWRTTQEARSQSPCARLDRRLPSPYTQSGSR